MANTSYVLIEKITVGAAGASSVTFASIPQTGYTDLVVKWSLRDTTAGTQNNVLVKLNGVTTSQSNRYLLGTGTAASSASDTPIYITGAVGNTATVNTFSNGELYIPNYNSGSVYKSVSLEAVTENNTSTAYASMVAGLYSDIAAVTSIQFAPNGAVSFMQYSTFYLYGVAKLGTTPAIFPKATGGDTIMTDGTYWYHAFLASGTFTPASTLTCGYLVIAGGGGGTGSTGLNGIGGAGAGGLRSTVTATGGGGTLESAVTLNSGIAYTVTIGAGGAAGAASTSGSPSSLAGTGLTTITSLGGGKKDTTGGSGGGGNYNSATYGLGTAGQGFRGGNGFLIGGGDTLGGGGGGSGAVGADAVNPAAGNGGVGVQITAFATPTGTGVSGFYAGGGGGSAEASGRTAGTGSSGGGNGAAYTANATSAIANTGSGGGAASSGTGGTGGSGLIIVRYPV